MQGDLVSAAGAAGRHLDAVDELLATAGRIKHLIADKGCDADHLRARLRAQKTQPVIPPRRDRKRRIRHDQRRYKERWRIEGVFCRLKDFRRIATRYDKLAANFLSAVATAAIIAFWV